MMAPRKETRGGVMNNPSIEPIDRTIVPEYNSGFCAWDLLWVVGICVFSLSLTPVVAFYMLMVA
jgi:hypothetical protein